MTSSIISVIETTLGQSMMQGGIYLCRVCDKCRKAKLSRYRLDVLENPQYESDEPIDPE